MKYLRTANTEEELEDEEVRATGKASSAWARLIRKIFEGDVLCCKKCGGQNEGHSVHHQEKIGKEDIEPPWRTD